MNYRWGDPVRITGSRTGLLGLIGTVVGRGHSRDDHVIVEVEGVSRVLNKDDVEFTTQVPLSQTLRAFIEAATTAGDRLTARLRHIPDLKPVECEHLLMQIGVQKGRVQGCSALLALLDGDVDHPLVDHLKSGTLNQENHEEDHSCTSAVD